MTSSQEIAEEVAGMISDRIGESLHDGEIFGINARDCHPEGPVAVIELYDKRVIRITVEVSGETGE
jgi:hypothetical protein